MTVETKELTNFHLGRSQKQALRARAKAKGTNVAEEIRNAVDAYLSGVTPDELALLDAATRRASEDIAEMNAMLEATNRNAARVFAELEKLRGAGAGETLRRRPAAARSARGRSR